MMNKLIFNTPLVFWPKNYPFVLFQIMSKNLRARTVVRRATNDHRYSTTELQRRIDDLVATSLFSFNTCSKRDFSRSMIAECYLIKILYKYFKYIFKGEPVFTDEFVTSFVRNNIMILHMLQTGRPIENNFYKHALYRTQKLLKNKTNKRPHWN